VWKNLAVMVGLPYLRYKLDEGYDIHAAPSNTLLFGSGPQYNRDILPPDATLKQRFMYYYRWFLRNVYPSLNAAYYFSVLAFNLAYLFDNSKYSSPFLWLIGTRLRRLGQADHRAIALATNPPPQPSSSRPGETTSIFHPRTIYPRLLSSLRILLPTSIFALKFLEWWHASDFSRQLTAKAAEGLDLPPPVISGLPSKTQPSKLQAEDSAKKQSKKSPPVSSTSYLPIFTVPLPKPAQSSLCPICLHALSNPAAVQTGYVFDYVCIFKWVEGTHERQEMFMSGEDEGVWGDDDDEEEGDKRSGKGEQKVGSREGKWESGKGRCAVTGRRVLGGTEGIRRVMV
jgi:peroxin-12